MTTPSFSPPLTPADQAVTTVRRQGYAVLSAAAVGALVGCAPEALRVLEPSWSDLPPDEYLKDGGRYRRRRHASFVAAGPALQAVPHRAHWQPVAYNALHGGMERWFAPMSAADQAQPAWQQLVLGLAGLCSTLRGNAPAPWYVEAHQFRIDTTDGIGRPTPEGAHRDGVDFVAVVLVGRQGIKGGETRVFEAEGPNGQRFTLTEPWSLLFLDDARVIHESTPIQPLEAGGQRDTLVLTFRANGFQDA
ncbi:2OG-Fe dioxygenase family protein [Pseudorhodoferax sp.]|uniref:2OG-Fe dioxygenase family protein n=1 Tax=Pseudorhodoferax sp. TaxID=1993553 RepID=UPI002DD67D60|nr:2OG-Fe dioxygenase family protein [Pseudorhodoferax sp.]